MFNSGPNVIDINGLITYLFKYNVKFSVNNSKEPIFITKKDL